jgi:hypothetical protein
LKVERCVGKKEGMKKKGHKERREKVGKKK